MSDPYASLLVIERNNMKSVAENTVEEMSEWIIGKAGLIVDRDLTEIEKTFIEYAVTQMKYEFWK
jgi:hypothetical protein